MKKDFVMHLENLELPEDIRSEVLLLYNLGVDMEDLKYFIVLRMNRVI